MNPAQDAAVTRALEIEVRKKNEHFHPLELFPVFRRWPHSIGRDFIYTFIWNCLIGFAFMGIAMMFGARPSWRMVREMLFFSNCIGYIIHMLFFIAARAGWERWVNSRGKLIITAYYTVLPTTGVLLGVLLASLFLGRDVGRMIGSPSWLLAVAANAFVISLIIGVIYFWREKSLVSDMRIAAERERMAQAERAVAEANLRALQAQIEPHFLFNTLANVVGLIHPQPEVAKKMLEAFIAYLRATLDQSRRVTTTLGDEFLLMENFLSILQIRMGERLRVSVNCPEDLKSFALPPMLLQPLVENAIKHGLEPKVEGGALTLTAVREGESVRIAITDTGVGFSGATSNGVGLQNVRERLDKLFGGSARLLIEENEPSGTSVKLQLPVQSINHKL